MFCPKCAAQNVDGASFCRVCGANISLIAGALSGELPESKQAQDASGYCGIRRKRGREPNIESVMKNVFMGVAFLCVSIALAFSRMGMGWWFWMLIPAFSMMGTGAAQYMRLRERRKQQFLPGAFGQAQRPLMSPPRRVDELPTRQTGELVAPPASVTEGTTRHLGAEMPTRHFDESN